MMKTIFILFISFVLFSCNIEKASKIVITNNNNYPISVTIKTNNISQTFSGIKPNETKEEWYQWSGLNKEDGEWNFIIINETNQTKEEYSHGFFRDGTLYNYVTLISEGDQLKVQISE